MEKLTREQAMVIISKAMMITGLNAKLPSKDAEELLRPFTDADNVSKWARRLKGHCPIRLT